MKLVALVALVAIAVPANAATRAFTAAERKEAVEVAVAVRDQFDAELFDYPAARFRTVVAATPHGGRGVRLCGFVNSKNRMGAYSGWKAFVVLAGGLSFDPIMVDVLCSPDDIDIDTRDYSADVTYR